MTPQPRREEMEKHAIAVHMDRLLAEQGMTLAELSHRVGVTVVNLSILKNGRAKAIRFSTLTRLCEALDCQPGDLLSHHQETTPPHSAHTNSNDPVGDRRWI